MKYFCTDITLFMNTGNVLRDRCYFYPDRDCNGWEPGDICLRVNERIPTDAVQKEGEQVLPQWQVLLLQTSRRNPPQ